MLLLPAARWYDTPMLALTNMQWGLTCLLAILYLFTCARVAAAMKQAGRNPLAWFFITLCLTAVPATIVLWIDRYRSLKSPRESRAEREPRKPPGPRRCPHCQAVIPGELPAGPDGTATCPDCGLTIDEVHLA